MIKEQLEQLKSDLMAIDAKLDTAMIEVAEEISQARADGFAEGAASVGSDKIFSQAEMDMVVSAQETQLAELNAQITGMSDMMTTLNEKYSKLLAAVNEEIEDSKQDTARLEAALS